MKGKILILILLFLIFLVSAKAEDSMEYSLGVVTDYSSYSAKVGSEESSFNTFRVGLKTYVAIDDTKKIYFGGGYQNSGFGDELIFDQMPLSVETDFRKGGLFFFLGGNWDLLQLGENFYFTLNPEATYQTSTTSWEVKEYDYVEGKVDGKIYALTLRVAGELQYDSGETLQPFGGVAFHYFLGKVKFKELIKDIEGEQEEEIAPKLPVEIYLGTGFSISEEMESRIKIGFLNGLSFGASLWIVF